LNEHPLIVATSAICFAAEKAKPHGSERECRPPNDNHIWMQLNDLCGQF
jgi:hypothetical protein